MCGIRPPERGRMPSSGRSWRATRLLRCCATSCAARCSLASVAAAKTDYTAEDLMHRQVVCVFNLPPRRVAGVQSEVLVLAATHADGTLRLLIPDPEAELGSHIT